MNPPEADVPLSTVHELVARAVDAAQAPLLEHNEGFVFPDDEVRAAVNGVLADFSLPPLPAEATS